MKYEVEMALNKKLYPVFLFVTISFAICTWSTRAFSSVEQILEKQRPTHTYRQSNKGQQRQGGPLRVEARFKQRDRTRAVYRGLRFIYGMALVSKNFDVYGSDYVWWFYNIESSVKDANLRRMARQMGRERATKWRRLHSSLLKNPDAATVADLVFGSQAADYLGVRDIKLKGELERAAQKFSARDYFRWDPLVEPPPSDLPQECQYDRAEGLRGASLCPVCKRPLVMRSRYDVWYDALITTYSGDKYGVKLGSNYVDVLKWLPTLRPYARNDKDNSAYLDSIFAVTHIVYTLNEYGRYRLSPQWLPLEFQFLEANMKERIAADDAETVGELMDTLKSFGLKESSPSILAGTDYLLSHQNNDGSWGDINDKDIYGRYHPTLTAVSGLCDYEWKGEGLSFPAVKPILIEWAAELNNPPR
jgi:hypothetical protein